MQVIITGATGNAGRETLKHCVADDRITKIFVLSRKELAEEFSKNEKIEVILHQDFLQYPDELMTRLQGTEACLWTIGGKVDKFNGDKDLCRKANVDYTLAAANAMLQKLAPHAPNGKFRFVFCSGQFTVWDQDETLLFLNDSRKIKGLVEKGLSDLADQHPDQFEVWFPRPSGFMEADAPGWKKMVGGLYGAIPIEQVGKVMAKVGVEGWKDRFIENEVMLTM